MSAKSLDKNLKGVAGVHFVVAQLSLRGFVALPTTRNLKSFDIVAFKPDNPSDTIFLQVKSTDRPKGGWPVYTIPTNSKWENNSKWEELVKESVFLGKKFFYIFVKLPTICKDSKEEPEPSFYIVSSNDVAEMLIKDTTDWLDKHKNSKPAR
jgi:hypothetical protein